MNGSSLKQPDPVGASIALREEVFIRDFSELADWMLQYEYVLYYIEDLNDIPKSERTDALKAKGCVSNAWMRLSTADDGTLFLELTSDALIIKGILGIITALIGKATAVEIAAWHPRFIEETALKYQLSIDRQKGILSILSEIKKHAKAYVGRMRNGEGMGGMPAVEERDA